MAKAEISTRKVTAGPNQKNFEARLPETERSFSSHPRERPRLSLEELRIMHSREQAIADRVIRALNRTECHVAVISRAGADLKKYHFDEPTPDYTHSGFAVCLKGQWQVFQLLNTHAGLEGHLYWQKLIDFFRDDPFEYRCGIIVPSADLQDRIAIALKSPLLERFYTPRYNRLAYPYSTRYQNSNQWVAEVIGGVQSFCPSRSYVQEFLRENGMVPSVLRTVGILGQAAYGMISPNTNFDDHPYRNRMRGQIEFLTETSIRNYLQATDRIELAHTISLEPAAEETFDLRMAGTAA